MRLAGVVGTVYKHHDLTHNIDKLAMQQDEMLKLCENHVKNNLFCIYICSFGSSCVKF